MIGKALLHQRFHPPLWAILLYAVILIIMLLLARWQLLRADEKIALQQAADAARQSLPVDLSTSAAADLDLLAKRYGRVSVSGQWVLDRQFLWDNRSNKGRAGFEVITPLELDNGKLVLVNRGWIAPGVSRSDLPDVSMAVAESTQTESGSIVDTGVHVTGLFSRPSRGFAQGEPFIESSQWPRTLQYFEYASISDSLGAQVLPGVVQVLDASQEEQSVDASSTWLIPNWQPAASGPAKHYSYAFQWFAMAVALTVLFIVTNLSKRPTALKEDHHDKTTMRE